MNWMQQREYQEMMKIIYRAIDKYEKEIGLDAAKRLRDGINTISSNEPRDIDKRL